MNVDRVLVGDVLALARREVSVDPVAEYRLIGIYSFGKGIFHREPKTGAELGNYRFFSIKPGDLVLSNIQAWEGAIALADQEDLGTIGTHRFLTYVPIDDRIDTNWARWFFLSEPGMDLIRQAAPGTTMRNRTLAIDRFEALKIPLPPIDQQCQVADRLARLARAAYSLSRLRDRADAVADAIPISLRAELEKGVSLIQAPMGEVLELVRDPVDIDPTGTYVTIGLRSFGNGVFHYPPRPGAEIGKLRFQSVKPRVLAISNIKAWEGAVATTSDQDKDTVASNRFLFFRPLAGEDATDYFWSLLLGREGLAALGRASPGSADRNRTLAVDRFRQIELMIPRDKEQVAIGRRVQRARIAVAQRAALKHDITGHVDALLPAALNAAFAGVT